MTTPGEKAREWREEHKETDVQDFFWNDNMEDEFAQSKIPVLSFSGEAKTIEILTIDPWVSVEEELPKEEENVLLFDPKNYDDQKVFEGFRMKKSIFRKEQWYGKWNGAYIGYYGDGETYEETKTVTHWMPLPEKPKQL